MNTTASAWVFIGAAILGFGAAGLLVWLWRKIKDGSYSFEPEDEPEQSSTPRIPRKPGQ